jgi:O-antigen biosynthesis protein
MHRAVSAIRRAGSKLLRYTGLEPLVGARLRRYLELLAERAEPYRQRRAAARFPYQPTVSLLVPVDGDDVPYLPGMIASVRKQSYPHWELLLLADSESTTTSAARVVAGVGKQDRRIHLLHCAATAVVARLNHALEQSSGDFVGLLYGSDELAPAALFSGVRLLNEHPGVGLVYTDENQLSPRGEQGCAFFKPAWSPEHFLSCMYTGGLSLYRRSTVREKGAFREGFGTAYEYDLALRISEGTRAIHHLPLVLYHRRVAALARDTPPFLQRVAGAGARRAVADHLKRKRLDASCEPGLSEVTQRVRFRIAGRPLVSILIPTGGFTRRIDDREIVLVIECVRSLVERTDYPHYEIVCVDDGDLGTPTNTALRAAAGARLRQISHPGPFNFAAKINLGASHAAGEHLLLLNDDMEILSPGWLSAMLEFSQQPEIGVVGAKLYYPDRAIQHAGVVVPPEAFPAHVYRGFPAALQPAYYDLHLVRNYSAVTGACMMTRRAVFEAAGGFDPAFPVNYNDIDYCLKVRELGYRIVYTPYAELLHFESISRGAGGTDARPEELELFDRRWRSRGAADPFHDSRRSAVWSVEHRTCV